MDGVVCACLVCHVGVVLVDCRVGLEFCTVGIRILLLSAAAEAEEDYADKKGKAEDSSYHTTYNSAGGRS